MSTNPRLILYCRKSSESEDRQQLSLDAQEAECRRIAERRGLVIVGDVLHESRSAKYPGRPVFGEMMRRIRTGEADGILCWHLDRLARNPADGGEVMQEVLDGRLGIIVTASGDYDGDGNDALMMSILFGVASQYSRTLSKNIQRGNLAALEAGRWPGMPPLGYVRNRRTRELEPDPVRYELVERMWKLRLAGVPASEIVERARNEWGLTTPKTGRRGGGLLPKSAAYRVLSDPFYAGVMRRKEGEFIGNHQAMITLEQFRSFEAPTQRTVTKSDFLYNGLIRCGSCGNAVTVERTTNRHGTTYIYYHCARKSRRYGYCAERSVTEERLTEQFAEHIEALHVPDDIFEFGMERIRVKENEEIAKEERNRTRRKRERDRIHSQLAALRGHLADGTIERAEYLEDKARLTRRELDLRQADADETATRLIEPLEEAYSYLSLAKSAFLAGERREKRVIIRKLFSNPTLASKKLRCVAKFPFDRLAEMREFPGQ